MIDSLAVYLHDLDPFAVWFIRWYGLSYLLGFVLAFYLVQRVTRCGRSPIRPEQTSDLIVTWAIGIMIGGRLGYALFYQPSLFWTFSSSAPWWDLLAINKGGMASHGGILGFIVASVFYGRRHKVSVAHVLDLGAFPAPLGLGFGRVANFINGELYGRGPTDVPWAVKFPQEIFNWKSPEQFAKLDSVMAQMPPNAQPHDLVTAIQNGDAQIAAALEPLLTPRHPSQLYEALLEGLVLFLVLAIIWYKPRRPLVIGSYFCIVYALVRILGEQFREPDDHIGFDALGLTRGQWLSVLPLIAGLILLWIFSRRNVERLGSWRRQPGA